MKLNRVKTTLCSIALLLMAALPMSGCRGTQNWLSREKGSSLPQEKRTAAKSDQVKLNDDQTFDVEFAMARTLEQQGDLKRAERAYRALLERKQCESKVLHRLAIVCDRQNCFQDAEQQFKRAIALNPHDADLQADYGYSLYRQRRWTEAEKSLRLAITSHPANRRAHNHLGLALGQMDRREEALAEFMRAGCTEAEAHVNVALVLTMNDQFEEARQEYAIASRIGLASPESQERARQLDAILAEAGIQDSAVIPAGGLAQKAPIELPSAHVGRVRVTGDY